jgi:hypothetical protein
VSVIASEIIIMLLVLGELVPKRHALKKARHHLMAS